MSYVKATAVWGRPGHAIVEIGYVLQVDPLLLTIQRAGRDQRYLAADGGWRGEPQTLQPSNVERRATCTLVYIGPEVVNRIDDNERIRIEILSAGFTGDLVWSDIPPSAEGGGASPFQQAPKPVAAPVPPTEPEPEIRLGPAEEEVEAEEIEAPPVPPRQRRWLFPLLILLALVMLLGGGGAFWHFKPWPWPEEAKRDKATDDLPRLRTQLQHMMETNGDAGQILDGGMRLIDSDDPALRDFGLRAIDAAAMRSSSAQLKLGKLFDPRYFRAGRGGIERANPAMAAESYKKAAGTSPEAAAELKGLCGKLAQPLDGIDEQARTVTIAQYCD